MIDKITGQLKFGNGRAISPTTKLGELKALKLSEAQEERVMGNGWILFIVRNVEDSGKFLNLTFFFHEETLDSISFVIDDSPIDLDRGWGSWGEKGEKLNAVLYNEWLNGELGADRTFTWGNAWADYDPKGGGSSMGIKYRN